MRGWRLIQWTSPGASWRTGWGMGLSLHAGRDEQAVLADPGDGAADDADAGQPRGGSARLELAGAPRPVDDLVALVDRLPADDAGVPLVDPHEPAAGVERRAARE